MDLKLSGSRVLVTGGTKGIGRAIVEAFVDEGAEVGFCARKPEEVTATRAALQERGKVIGQVLDVGDTPGLAESVFGAAGAVIGGIDTVVANVSALAIPDTEENWQASFNIDVMHTVRLFNAALPYLERSANGNIIAISSVSGHESDFGVGPLRNGQNHDRRLHPRPGLPAGRQRHTRRRRLPRKHLLRGRRVAVHRAGGTPPSSRPRSG